MKSILLVTGLYVGFYALTLGAAHCVFVLADKATGKIKKVKIKRNLKKEEERDFLKKAEANGWTIVECYYDIEETIEAV